MSINSLMGVMMGMGVTSAHGETPANGKTRQLPVDMREIFILSPDGKSRFITG